MEIIRYSFQKHGDERGMLVALEENKEIPFNVKRIYYMYDTIDGVTRGYHAHKTLNQILICINGSCEIGLDNGKEKESVVLNRPDEGIFIGPGVWHTMYNFSKGAVLMVLASDYYNESDYIRNYEEFLKSMSIK